MSFTPKRSYGALAVLMALAAAAFATAGSSAASTAKSAQTITIAGVFQNTSDPFWTTIGCGAAAEAKTLGVTLKEFSNSTLSTSAVSADFNAAERIHPQGLFSDLLIANQFITQYKQLMQGGVPIIDSAPTTPAEQYEVLWTAPTTATSSFLPAVLKLVTKSSGDMAVLGGVPGLVPVQDRFAPLVAAIKKARPTLTELTEEYSQFVTNTAAQYVTATLLSHPKLKLIVAADGPDAVGAVNAVKAAGKAGKVQIIALDAEPPDISALKSGVITALIAQEAANVGADQVKALVKYIRSGRKGPVPASSKVVGVPSVLIDKANVNEPSISQYFYRPACS